MRQNTAEGRKLPVVWWIKYADGTRETKYGTKEEAEEKAKEKGVAYEIL